MRILYCSKTCLAILSPVKLQTEHGCVEINLTVQVRNSQGDGSQPGIRVDGIRMAGLSGFIVFHIVVADVVAA